ncbi:15973_t:CDS:2, partial [Acaulospora colombiana]
DPSSASHTTTVVSLQPDSSQVSAVYCAEVSREIIHLFRQHPSSRPSPIRRTTAPGNLGMQRLGLTKMSSSVKMAQSKSSGQRLLIGQEVATINAYVRCLVDDDKRVSHYYNAIYEPSAHVGIHSYSARTVTPPQRLIDDLFGEWIFARHKICHPIP